MTSAYEQNRLNLNTTRFNDPTRVQQQLETGKNIVKELTSPENVREQLFEMAIDSSIFLKSDNPLSAIRTIAARRAGKFILDKADIPARVATNYNDLNRLTKIGEKIKQPNLAFESGAVNALSQDPNILGSLTQGSNSYNKLTDIQKKAKLYLDVSPKLKKVPVVKGYKAASETEWLKYVDNESLSFAEKGKGTGNYFTLEHVTNPKKNIRYRFDNKGAKELDGILSDRSFSLKDISKKTKDNKQSAGTYRAKIKDAQITLEEYIEELGEELGTKGFNLDKQRMRRLRRWIGKNVHLDHINPISQGGFDHPGNLILLYAKDNLSKNAKILPDEFFTSMKIPKTKQELIRSSITNNAIPNKVKRQVLIEALELIKK